MASGDFDPERLFRTFHEAGVRFILVGGMAAILHGDVGVTIDLERSAGGVEAVEGVTIQVASLPDIIRSKEAADSDKDRQALPRLRRLLERLRDES